MRCPDCNKFVSLEEGDAEVNDLAVGEDGNVSVQVRIANCCAECGQELKEANFDCEQDHTEECKGHQGEGHELAIEENSSERTSRSGYFKAGKWVSAGGRYAKTMYGFSLTYTITCSCDNKFTVDGTIEDEIQASGMDEL